MLWNIYQGVLVRKEKLIRGFFIEADSFETHKPIMSIRRKHKTKLVDVVAAEGAVFGAADETGVVTAVGAVCRALLRLVRTVSPG